jgi:hypothetical protein
MKEIKLTSGQISTLKATIRLAIEESFFRFERMLKDFPLDEDAIERIRKSIERENDSREELLRLLEGF